MLCSFVALCSSSPYTCRYTAVTENIADIVFDLSLQPSIIISTKYRRNNNVITSLYWFDSAMAAGAHIPTDDENPYWKDIRLPGGVPAKDWDGFHDLVLIEALHSPDFGAVMGLFGGQ